MSAVRGAYQFAMEHLSPLVDVVKNDPLRATLIGGIALTIISGAGLAFTASSGALLLSSTLLLVGALLIVKMTVATTILLSCLLAFKVLM